MKDPVEAKLISISGDLVLDDENVSLKFMYCLLKQKEHNPEVSIFKSNSKEFDLEYVAPKDIYAATYHTTDDVSFTDFVNAYNKEKSAVFGIIAVNGNEDHRISFLKMPKGVCVATKDGEELDGRIVMNVYDEEADEAAGDILCEIMDELEKME